MPRDRDHQDRRLYCLNGQCKIKLTPANRHPQDSDLCRHCGDEQQARGLARAAGAALKRGAEVDRRLARGESPVEIYADLMSTRQGQQVGSAVRQAFRVLGRSPLSTEIDGPAAGDRLLGACR